MRKRQKEHEGEVWCLFRYTEGVLTVRVKAGFDQGTRSDLVVSSAEECRFEILC